MKKIILLVLAFPLLSFGQTNVDRVIHALDSLTIVTINDWKMSPNLKFGPVQGDPTKGEFDDSK